MERKTSEAHTRATNKYANSKYRPNVFINKEYQENIEKHFKSKGYKSFNEYIIGLIEKDMKTE